MDINAIEEAKQKNIEVFCCYARKDQPLLLDLKTHLMPLQREGLITLWADVDINAGAEWEKEIHNHLNIAGIILLLVSPDFMASDYCYSIEMKKALNRNDDGTARVIPIILRPVDWTGTPFSKLQALPTDGKPITGRGWHSRDEAFADVARSLHKVVEELRTNGNGVYQETLFSAVSQQRQQLLSSHVSLISARVDPTLTDNQSSEMDAYNTIEINTSKTRTESSTHSDPPAFGAFR